MTTTRRTQKPSRKTAAQQNSLWSDAWRSLRRSPVFIFGAATSFMFLLMALVPQLFARGIDPRAEDLRKARQTPSGEAWFGYDLQGQDLFANVVYGARNSMSLAIIVTVSAALIGVIIGALAGYYGGIFDLLMSRVMEIFYAIPTMLAALILLATVFAGSRNVWTVAAALIIFGWMTPARLIRAGVLSVKESEYVAAAKVLGASTVRIILQHILPNTVAPLIVFCTISFGQVIAAEAALSFLGIGLQSPEISWGLLVDAGRLRIHDVPHLILLPGMVISLAVFSFILMGDALREALDPKSR